jgi:hypothetical protein
MITREMELYSVSCDSCTRVLAPEDCKLSPYTWWSGDGKIALVNDFMGTFRLLKLLGWHVGTEAVLCPTCAGNPSEGDSYNEKGE